jgi:simple sugar transport system permease protein
MFSKAKQAAFDSVGSISAVVAAFIVVAVFLWLVDRDPIQTYAGIFSGAFGNWFAITETLVAATPIMLCALGVAIAAWVGLMSVGAEGQLYLGAVGATYVALALPDAPPWQVLPLMFVASCLCGALWSGVPGLLRAKFGVNETIVTLLLNYVAILLVEYLVHGPWQDPESFSWPQTPAFSAAAELPRWSGTRLHLGICFGLVLAIFFWWTLPRTRMGFIVRVIGGNPKAASYAHYPVARYLFVAMLVSGAIAALAGLGQVSAIEGRLRMGISPGYGYTGFLVSWLARHKPLAIVVIAVLMGGLLSGGDSLQLDEKLPFATINILQGCIFFFLLCSEYLVEKLRASRLAEAVA